MLCDVHTYVCMYVHMCYLNLKTVFIIPVQWPCCVLGHKEPTAPIYYYYSVGEQLCISLQQGQSEPSLQHEWV